MEQRNWLFRKIGFWFVPVKAGALGHEEWTKVRRVSRWGTSRRARRLLMLLWIGLLGIDMGIACKIARHDAPFALYPTLVLFGLVLWSFRRMEIGLAQPTLEDRAVMQYGEEFDALKERQRGEVFEQQIRDNILGRMRKDERETELRLHAEGAAYRLLRPSLVIVVIGYWAVCLMGPFEPIRETLVITAIAFTWLVLMVLVLPTMIRMWTEPDVAGEPRVVEHAGDSVNAPQ